MAMLLHIALLALAQVSQATRIQFSDTALTERREGAGTRAVGQSQPFMFNGRSWQTVWSPSCRDNGPGSLLAGWSAFAKLKLDRHVDDIRFVKISGASVQDINGVYELQKGDYKDKLQWKKGDKGIYWLGSEWWVTTSTGPGELASDMRSISNNNALHTSLPTYMSKWEIRGQDKLWKEAEGVTVTLGDPSCAWTWTGQTADLSGRGMQWKSSADVLVDEAEGGVRVLGFNVGKPEKALSETNFAEWAQAAVRQSVIQAANASQVLDAMVSITRNKATYDFLAIDSSACWKIDFHNCRYHGELSGGFFGSIMGNM